MGIPPFCLKLLNRAVLLKSSLKIIFVFLLLLPHLLWGQGFLDRVTDWFEFDLRKHRVGDTDSTFIPKIVASPVMTYEPATSVGLGVGIKILFRTRGAGADTRTSNMPIGLIYTLKNQLIFTSGYTVFFPHERWLLRGNLNYSDFPVLFFDAGPRSLRSEAHEIHYNNILVEPLLLRKVGHNDFFLGGGFRFNHYYGLRLKDNADIDDPDFKVADLASTSVGFELAASLDNRDNVLNATKGKFLEFTHGLYGKVLGGTHQFMLTKADYRAYLKPAPHKDHVLAYQLYMRYAWRGTPSLELSNLGGAELLRGFREFRWRDRFAYFAQLEYRYQAFRKIGLVFFGGLGDVTGPESGASFNTLKYSLGTGLRIKIIESENLNVRFDYALGMGRGNERNFYLGIAEAF